ncbi:hypothetical protein DL93DRAFT_781354 [Clavulina sp. PMI_390]|nr:hypothetical protein DL93DRAFT_781354 [Clavulina sp. PMI_390]
MSSNVLSIALPLLSLAAATVHAQTPLTDQIFPYNQIPYQVDTNPTGRGPQFGYNQCNSTTQGQNSDCQTALLNNIADFCLWGPPNPNSAIGDEEAETVAFCSSGGHGARTMPAGTLTGVQVFKAPAYVLFSGTINQVNVNIPADDGGGELDPHGADERGNPLGGLVYTNAFPSNNGNNNTFQQVIEWHKYVFIMSWHVLFNLAHWYVTSSFMGSEQFCFKICDPSVPNSKVYCNNIFDRTGCTFVAPAPYTEGVFEVCDSDNMDPVGIYTGADGQTSTYKQPAEGVDITSLPSIKTPASSNCKTYASTDLYAAANTISASGGSTSTSATGSVPTGSSTGTGVKTTVTTKPAGSSTGSGSHPTSTSSTGGAVSRVGGAGSLVVVGVSVLASLGALVVSL